MRRRLPFVLAALLLAVTVGLGTPGPGAPAQAAPTATSRVTPYTGGPYVAMGDSRAAGTHRTPTIGYYLGCLRSADSYPEILRAELKPRSFVDSSCAGATSPNLWSTAQRTPTYPRPPQVTQIPAGAQLLTISIGGNDMGWPSILGKCLVGARGEDKNCRGSIDMAELVDRRLAKMDRDASAALEVVRAKQPRAQIVMVGIGGFVGDRGCFPTVPLPDGDAAWMRSVFDRANKTLRRVAETVDASFIDIANLSEGRDACNTTAPWYEGQTNADGTLKWHFNRAGSTAIARLIERVVIR